MPKITKNLLFYAKFELKISSDYMINATDLKNGTTFLINDKPYQVIKYEHQKIGRGGANVKVKIRNLKTGDSLEKTFNSTAKFDEIVTQKRKLQFLYSDSDVATFVDPSTYQQYEINKEIVKDQLPFVKEGQEVDILFWQENGKDIPLSVDIPPKVNLEVVETAPGVKGDTASNVYKPAKLENGLSVKVPLFIKVGDKVKVDTRTSDYVERVKE